MEWMIRGAEMIWSEQEGVAKDNRGEAEVIYREQSVYERVEHQRYK